MRRMRPPPLTLAAIAAALALVGACSGDASDASTTTSATGAGGEATISGGAGGRGGAASTAGSAGHGGQGGAATSAGGPSGSGGEAISWGPCSVDGIPGECLDVADCTGDRAPTPGLCPGPANIQCCTVQGGAGGAGACDPSASPQPNVGLTEAPGTGGCPPGMARVEAFCVDRFEASLVDAATGEPVSPFHNPGLAATRAASIEGAVPQAYLDQLQAGDACANAGKRLCTDAEWLRACRGPDDFVYPYGAKLEPGVCNDHRDVHPAIEYFGTSDAWIWSELGNACLDQLPDSLDPAGANPGCVTAEGLFDLMGNLHEWTADPAGTFRGGYFVDTVLNGPGCLYATTAHDVTHWDYSTGFRCCADP